VGLVTTTGPQATVTAPAAARASVDAVAVVQPAGSLSAPATSTGSVGVVSVVGPAGSATLGTAISLSGSVATVSATEPAGSVSAPATQTGGVGVVTADAPAGSVDAPTVATGGVGVVDVIQPAGAFVGPSQITQTVERTLQWVETQTRTLAWAETHTRTLDIDMTSTIQPHDHYLAGESEIWEFTIQKDGSDYDVDGADVSWYLLPLDAEVSDVPADLGGVAVLDDGESGISLSITDDDGDGTSELVTLDIEQGITGTYAGYYTHVLVLDDPGTGLSIWSGDFPIGGLGRD
jgi:hypothetical protein